MTFEVSQELAQIALAAALLWHTQQVATFSERFGFWRICNSGAYDCRITDYRK